MIPINRIDSNPKIEAIMRVILGEEIRNVCKDVKCEHFELSYWVREFFCAGIEAIISLPSAKDSQATKDPYCLIEVSEHSFRLGRLIGVLFEDYNYTSSTHRTTDWLFIASSIKKVEFDYAHYGHCTFCSNDYEYSKSDILTPLMSDVLFFLYVWGALESTIELLNLPKLPKHINLNSNNINKAIYFIGTILQPKEMPFYNEIIDQTFIEIEQLATTSPIYKSLEKKIINSQNNTAKKLNMEMANILGLIVAKSVRNRLFHGDLMMPEPEEEALNRLLSKSNRLLLLSIQQLLLAYYIESETLISKWDYAAGSSLDNDIPLKLALRTLHLDIVNKKQLFLFDVL